MNAVDPERLNNARLSILERSQGDQNHAPMLWTHKSSSDESFYDAGADGSWTGLGSCAECKPGSGSIPRMA